VKTFQVPGLVKMVIPYVLLVAIWVGGMSYALSQPMADIPRELYVLLPLASIIVLGALLSSTYQVNVYDSGEVELVSLRGRKRVSLGDFCFVTDFPGTLFLYQGGTAIVSAHALMSRDLLDLIHTIRSQNPQFRIKGVLLPFYLPLDAVFLIFGAVGSTPFSLCIR
jgi:hypothetical protein